MDSRETCLCDCVFLGRRTFHIESGYRRFHFASNRKLTVRPNIGTTSTTRSRTTSRRPITARTFPGPAARLVADEMFQELGRVFSRPWVKVSQCDDTNTAQIIFT